MFIEQARIQLLNLLFIGAGLAVAFSPAAQGLRFGFPIAAAMYAGLLLHLRRPDHYVSLCLWLFLMTPLIRRIVDFRTGWDPVAVILLAPYAALVFSTLSVPKIFNRGRVMDASAVGFLLMFIAATVGLLIALATGRYLPGGYDYVRWVLPLAFGIFLWTNRKHLESIQRSIIGTLVLALPIMGIYGLFQFMDIQPWDAEWLTNSEMDTAGGTEKFQVRVFSTINSFGSLGHAMVLAVLLLVVSASPLKWIAIPLGLLALALTMSRTSWLALSVGLLTIVLLAPIRSKISVAVLVGALFFIVPAVVVFPELQTLLETRFETLTGLSGDLSIQERLASYEGWAASMLDQPLGNGLGAAGVYLRSLSRGDATNIIDGGPIEVIQALGIGFGLLYLVGIALVVWAIATRRGDDAHGNLMAGCRAVVAAQVVAFWSTTTTTGETGFFFFMAVGLALAIPHARRAEAPTADRIRHRMHQAEQVT